MSEYRVAWEIDICADSPRAAAEQALEIQRRKGSRATCFDVFDEAGEKTYLDLTALAEEGPPKPLTAPKGIRIFCRSCGGHNVLRDAWACWNEQTQQWELSTTFDEGFCQNCDGSSKLDDVELRTVFNPTLYNNCSLGCAPDWTLFDGFEINCCKEDTVSRSTNACALHEAEFFTVYGHLKDGGVEAITDVTTRNLAHQIANGFLQNIHDNVHGVYDHCDKGN